VCCLLRVDASCFRPETVLLGTDLVSSMYDAPLLLLAIMILLPILGQEYYMSYLSDNVSHTNIIPFSEHSYVAVTQVNAIYRSGQSSKTCHPYSLRRACFEQASLTQSH